MTFTLFRGVCSDKIISIKHPDVAQLAKMASVCRLCKSSVAYSHHRVALFGDDDDGLPNLMCAKCKQRVESLENHTWGHKPLKGLRNCLLKIRTFITRHYNIILRSLLYRVQTLTSHNTRKNQKIVQSPHILGRLNACAKQCVPGASPFFAHAGDEATFDPVSRLFCVASYSIYLLLAL